MTVHKDHPCDGRNYQRGRAQRIKYLVIHYVGATGGAEANCLYYGRESVGASAHYYVGHAPRCEIWQSVSEGDTAWHCGTTKGYRHEECRNANSIGVEICCHQRKDGTWYFDAATVDAAVALCREIMARHGIDISHVVRHYDVTGKICPAPFVEDAGAWESFQKRLTEPGEEVEMSREEIRAMVAEEVRRALAERDAVTAKTAQKVSQWANEEWDEAQALGLMDGTRPGGVVAREQLAAVAVRLYELLKGGA